MSLGCPFNVTGQEELLPPIHWFHHASPKMGDPPRATSWAPHFHPSSMVIARVTPKRGRGSSMRD